MKRNLISILVAIFVLSVCSTVYAAQGSIELGTSSEKVKVGDSFTLSVIGNADYKIKGMETKLSYDTSKLEITERTLDKNIFTDLSSGDEIAIFSQENKNLTNTTTLYTLTFKVLDTAEEGNVVINFKDTALAVDSEDSYVDIPDDSVEVLIEKVETDKADDESDKKDESDKTEAGSDKKGDTKLPQTGIEDVSIVSVVILAVITTLSYIGYRRYKDI